jgi:hypothetical protein
MSLDPTRLLLVIGSRHSDDDYHESLLGVHTGYFLSDKASAEDSHYGRGWNARVDSARGVASSTSTWWHLVRKLTSPTTTTRRDPILCRSLPQQLGAAPSCANDYFDYTSRLENLSGVGFTPSTTCWNRLWLVGFINKPSRLHRRPLRLCWQSSTNQAKSLIPFPTCSS